MRRPLQIIFHLSPLVPIHFENLFYTAAAMLMLTVPYIKVRKLRDILQSEVALMGVCQPNEVQEVETEYELATGPSSVDMPQGKTSYTEGASQSLKIAGLRAAVRRWEFLTVF